VLVGPAVTLATAPDGRHNWAFLTAGPDDGGDAPLPVIESLRVNNAVLTYVDGRRGIRTQALIDSARGSITGPRRALDFQVSGSLGGAPLRIVARAGALALAAGASEPLPVHVELSL